jgi:hypothetical protein
MSMRMSVSVAQVANPHLFGMLEVVLHPKVLHVFVAEILFADTGGL